MQKRCSPKDLKVGHHYRWYQQPEVLRYMGMGAGPSRWWHQFELADKPGVVWCEVLSEDIPMLEEVENLCT